MNHLNVRIWRESEISKSLDGRSTSE